MMSMRVPILERIELSPVEVRGEQERQAVAAVVRGLSDGVVRMARAGLAPEEIVPLVAWTLVRFLVWTIHDPAEAMRWETRAFDPGPGVRGDQ